MNDHEQALSLDYCPNCGGEADNGHSRDVPPVPYFCKACSVPKTVWNCHKCFPKLCRCEGRNEAPNVEALDAARAVLRAVELVIQREEPCATCNGSGWVTRDPDIGTDRECSVCDGKGRVSDA